jgi:hypothetical protein
MQKVNEGPPLVSAANDPRSWINHAFVTLNPLLSMIGRRLNRVLPLDGSETMTGPLPLAQYTTAGLPAASSATGSVVFDTTVGAFKYSNGSSWIAAPAAVPWGSIGTIPDLGTWTWVNQGSGTAAQAGGTTTPISMRCPGNSALNYRLLVQNAPATPYSVVFGLRSMQFEDSGSPTGAYFYDGTKLMGLNYVVGTLDDMALRIDKMNTVTSSPVSAFTASQVAAGFQANYYVRLRQDSTTLYFDYGMDGWNFYNLYSEATGTFISPTKVGFGGMTPAAFDSTKWFENILFSYVTLAHA